MKNSILIFEESKALRTILITILKNDFEVYSTSTYAEAFYYLRSKKFVDLIIMNVSVDKSENFKFLSHLCSSSLFCDIPIVVLSDSKESQVEKKVKAMGVPLYLTFPFDPIRLTEKVKELICENVSSRLFSEPA